MPRYCSAPAVISIHAPHAGSDGRTCAGAVAASHFNPRSPCGERPRLYFTMCCAISFQSSLPVWGATATRASSRNTRSISILAPRVGSDTLRRSGCCAPPYFNPRSPCGERLFPSGLPSAAPPFQSSLPVRGATGAPPAQGEGQRPFNPRSPCGERLITQMIKNLPGIISILAPRAGSDALTRGEMADGFKSSLPVRGATDSAGTHTR